MGVNKVVFGDVAIMDISDSTVTKDNLALGETAYGADGEKIVGTFTISEELSEQDSLIAQIEEALRNKVSGGNTTTEIWTFTMEDGSEIQKEVVIA